VIRNGHVIQAGAMGLTEIDACRAYDEAEKRAYYMRPTQSWLTDLWSWIKRIFQ
jgi:hypothetical protein